MLNRIHIENYKCLRDVSVDVVFHLAGFSNPSASIDHSAAAYAGNAATTARIVRETRAGR